MRVIIIEQAADLHSLPARLFKKTAGRGPAPAISPRTMEQIKLLNPHVDLHNIETGTVLLLPDAPELHAADSQPLTGDLFKDVIAGAQDGLQEIERRMRLHGETLALERAAVDAVVGIASVRRMVTADKLEEQLRDAGAALAAEEEKTRDGVAQLEAMQQGVAAELASLARLLR